MATEIKNYYENLAPQYDEDRFGGTYGQYIHQQEETLLKAWGFQKKTPKAILSLGCGTGRFMEYASHGLDISAAMLKEAATKFPNKLFRCGNATQTSFENKDFKKIFCFHVCMHLTVPDLNALLKEVHRLLDDGGEFVFDLPSENRRKMLQHKQATWHGNNSLMMNELEELLGEKWHVEKWTGVLFFPIHRFPNFMRKILLPLDNLLCRSFLKKYASYWMIKVRKK